LSADAVAGADDESDDGGLDAEEDGLERGRGEIERQVEPGEEKHQGEARQHEAESGEHAAPAAAGEHAEVDAEFVRFGAGQHLVDGEEAFEMGGRDPFFLGDEFLSDHVDLGDGSAPGEEAEAQEAEEELAVGFGGSVDGFLGVAERCGGGGHREREERGEGGLGGRRNGYEKGRARRVE